MSSIEELRQRVEAAEQNFGLFDEQQRRYSERLIGLMDTIDEGLRVQQSREGEHQDQVNRIAHENEELKSMLHSLLLAIESGTRDTLSETMQMLEHRASGLVGQQDLPAPEEPGGALPPPDETESLAPADQTESLALVDETESLAPVDETESLVPADDTPPPPPPPLPETPWETEAEGATSPYEATEQPADETSVSEDTADTDVAAAGGDTASDEDADDEDSADTNGPETTEQQKSGWPYADSAASNGDTSDDSGESADATSDEAESDKEKSSGDVEEQVQRIIRMTEDASHDY